MTGWHVGMQVVCIAVANPLVLPLWTRGYNFTFPIKGLVYTIREFGVYDKDLILLEEVRNPIPDGSRFEPGFGRKYFRPVRKTSIDCFKSLLNPRPEEVLAGTAGGNDYDVPSVAADERTSFLPGVSSRCLTARLLLSGGGGPSFLHRVTSRERLVETGTAGAQPLGGCGGGGEPPLVGDEHITTGDTRDVGILTRACG